jgi:uncharacterized protein YecT (DUF1311 family)
LVASPSIKPQPGPRINPKKLGNLAPLEAADASGRADQRQVVAHIGLHSRFDPVQGAPMKSYLKLAAVAAVSVVAFLGIRSDAFEPPGAAEQAEVDRANKVLDGVYNDLMSKGDSEEQTSLREAERAWIKWRDAEAMYIARHGGAVGGSALRTDYAVAQLKLINERIAVLKAYKSQPPAN